MSGPAALVPQPASSQPAGVEEIPQLPQFWRDAAREGAASACTGRNSALPAAAAGAFRYASPPAAFAQSTSDRFASDGRPPSPPHAPVSYISEEDSETGTLRTMPGPERKQQYRTSNEPQPSSADLVEALPQSLAPPAAPFASASPVPSNSSAPYAGTTLSPSPASSSSAGVQLVEDISPNAKVLQRQAGPRSSAERPTNVTNSRSIRGNSISKGQLGTSRTMSHRGKKPIRVVKRRVINKIDAKSYFSSERTMYSWVMIGSIILGISLNLYGYISIDPDLARIGLQTGTVLSVLALLIFFYAAHRYVWRRQALSRGMAATAFDDRMGSWMIGVLLVAGLCLNVGLAWRSPVGLDVRVHDRSFVAGDRCGLKLHATQIRNPYKKGDPTHRKGSLRHPIKCP